MKKLLKTATLMAALSVAQIAWAQSTTTNNTIGADSTDYGPDPVEAILPGSQLPFDPLSFIGLTSYWRPVNNNIFQIQKIPYRTGFDATNVSYVWMNQPKKVSAFLNEVATHSLVVIKDGHIVTEKYYRGWTAEQRHQSWSVAKSFAATLIGKAIEEGHIGSIDDPITKYVPSLAVSGFSGFNGVTIRQALTMQTGIDWKETQDLDSPLVQLMVSPWIHALTLGTLGRTTDEVVHLKKHKRVGVPGVDFKYASIVTQVLGMVVSSATGKRYSSYLEEKIWKPLGMEKSGRIVHDDTGRDISFAHLYATPRDFARFGLLYLNRGKVGNKQVISADFVDKASSAIVPKTDEVGFGYGYQFWIPTPQTMRGDYMAWGIQDQHVWVDPKNNVVIVKLGSDIQDVESIHGYESVVAYRAISDALSQGK